MAAAAKRVEIGVEDRRELERLVRSRTAERRAVERARIVLAAAAGRSDRQASNRGVPDISADRWTDTISSAPSATACS